ncbi:LppP/LprE family lipoprotein [Corynebacterium pilosum]|uniref:LppP/LprE family lipoprotein n=1 Tax=Corynebacterium pilosum TaxID=35756 RepID=UPI00137919DC
MHAHVGDLPHQEYPWSADHANTEGYDPCAALSWIVVPIYGGTGGSPDQIMLYNYGEFARPATDEVYSFPQAVTRVDDSTISVTYRFVQDSDPSPRSRGMRKRGRSSELETFRQLLKRCSRARIPSGSGPDAAA